MPIDGFFHGVEVIKLDSNPRPIETINTSIIGLLGTAPDADPAYFPEDTPVAIFGSDVLKRSKLGYRGTLKWALDGIFDNSAGAVVVVVRIRNAPKPKTDVLTSLSNPTQRTIENVTRGAGEIDELAQDEVASIARVTMGDHEYVRGVDWERVDSTIKWLRYSANESVYRRNSAVDPLDHQENILEIKKVFAGNTVFTATTDYRIDETGGIEWVEGGRSPDPHTEYFILYEYGTRPKPNNTYACVYNHFVNNVVTGEPVIRHHTRAIDALANTTIIDINRVYVGATNYTKNTDWSLDGDNVRWLATSHTATLTRGATAKDAIPNTFILDVSTVQQGLDIFTKDVDWRLTTDGEIEWLTSNEPAEAETYEVNYTRGRRPAKNTEYLVDYSYKAGEITALSSAVGGVSDETGSYTGVHAFLAAESTLGLKPKILVAPGFTHYVAVTTELLGIAERLKAVVLADGPSITDAHAIQFRNEFNSPRLMIIDPWAQFWNAEMDQYDYQPVSARAAGIMNRIDNEMGYWASPSNKDMLGITGISRPIPHDIAQYLNSQQVTTVTRYQGGYQLFGNRPPTADSTYVFLTYTRIDDAIAESIERALRSLVDKPINKAFWSLLCESVENYLRNLARIGAIYLGDRSPVWVDEKDNTPDQLYLGKVTVNMDYVFTPTAEHIMIKRVIEMDYLKTAFKDSEYVRA